METLSRSVIVLTLLLFLAAFTHGARNSFLGRSLSFADVAGLSLALLLLFVGLLLLHTQLASKHRKLEEKLRSLEKHLESSAGRPS